MLTDREEMSNINRGPSIDVSFQVSVHLPNGFRGEEFKKSANQKHELSVAALFANEIGRNQQSL